MTTTPEELRALFERTERRALAKEPAVSRIPDLTRRRWVAEAVLRRLPWTWEPER